MVVVVSKTVRHDGSLEVVLSQDGTRFTIIVPAIVDSDPNAPALYQIIANGVCKQANVLDGIIQAGKGF